jgi:hypothetical protein
MFHQELELSVGPCGSSQLENLIWGQSLLALKALATPPFLLMMDAFLSFDLSFVLAVE